MQAWPAAVQEKIHRYCQEAFDFFSKQAAPRPAADALPNSRSKRFALNVEDQQYLEMIVSPVNDLAGNLLQVMAVVLDATSTRRLQQKINAIDNAGRELVRLEAGDLGKMTVPQRLKLLEDKIISFTRDLMHFDHFAIRLLDRKSNKLELVITYGLPPEALSVELKAEPEGNGISGYVACTGRSYICPDVARDPRYIHGVNEAQSTLTVPLLLHDKVVGIFNVESKQKGQFGEDDKQFAEIFGRYVALALNMLDLLLVERVAMGHKVADDVTAEMAGPLNDIALDATNLKEELETYIGHDGMRQKVQTILDNVDSIRRSLRQVAEGGANVLVLGAQQVKACHDPILQDAHILLADDDENIRETIADVLRKYEAKVTVCTNGTAAIAELAGRDFDLVLSDIKMPDKSGYDVFDAARKHDASTPVILMTGFGYDPGHSIVRASQEGLAAVLYQPFKVEQLLTEVRKAIEGVGARN
jgi:CheY-like chemotaxis protein